MEKLVTVIMGDHCAKFMDMSFKSVIDSDKIVFCWGEEDKETIEKFGEWSAKHDHIEHIRNKFDQADPKMNGRQRNFYLDYVKENYPDYWCLAIDADEVVEDLSKIKEFINKVEPGIYSPKMRHLIQDLKHEDATHETHWVLNRLFKISEAWEYPEVEHPVLKHKNQEAAEKEGKEGFIANMGNTDCTTIWHLAYIPNLWAIKKRYESHMLKSNMHTPEYLKQWYHAHIFGEYPVKQFNPVELPDIILKEFNVDKDELYFANRGLEHKHWIDAVHWRDFFGKGVAFEHAIEFGAGRGPRVYAMNQVGLKAKGIELSQFAVDNALSPRVYQGNILEYSQKSETGLVIAYDLLEHISYEDLDKAINNMINILHINGKILVSVPVIGDPNLENDPTHIIKETKEWWIKQFTDKGLKQIEVPSHFLFRDQLMIFEKQ